MQLEQKFFKYYSIQIYNIIYSIIIKLYNIFGFLKYF